MKAKNIIALCFAVVFLFSLLGKAQSPDIFLARGHRPGQYYLYGPVPDGIAGINMRTDNYGLSITSIMRYDTLVFAGFYPDARDSCLYAFSYVQDYWCRTFDRGESWERCEAQGAFGGSPATGRIPGEIYTRRIYPDSSTTKYSLDYGDSYDEYRRRGGGGLMTVGHNDGEIFCRWERLYRSTDYGRNFEVVFEGDDNTDFFPNYDILKRGPEEGELFLFRPNTEERGYYISYSDDHGESFTRLCRVHPPPTDYFEFWDYSFAPGIRAGEISVGWLAFELHGFAGCLFIYFSNDYGRNWTVYETSNNSDWRWDVVDDETQPPNSVTLLCNYPNPFNQYTNICFTSQRNQSVRFEILDLTGRVVDIPFTGSVNAGEHLISWPQSGFTSVFVPSGSYFCRLTSEESNLLIPLVMVK
ncbi:MAG: T9SS type A sorting domain-containing protein [Candidatus Hatepunaea meridiana]|nr:T9SS type A sorting domain-containing protein [Candidatus Hatepunaea meridiana]